MASKLSLNIVATVNKPVALASSVECAKRVDEALAPVRECLEGLTTYYERNERCWCRTMPRNGEHSEACLRTRAVYESLKVTE